MDWFIFFILYFLLDVSYYFRAIYTYVYAKYFRTRIGFLDSSEVYGICLPTDADFNITHMNNARYLREFDFCRYDLCTRNGIMIELMKTGSHGGVVSASTIRYRLPLMMFKTYKIVTRPLWWDNKSMYFEQRVITLSDNITRSVAIVKYAFVFCEFEKIVAKLHPSGQKPEMTEDLKKWIETNQYSSDRLKNE